MKTALPLEKTIRFLTGLKSQAGKISKIKRKELLQNQEGLLSYKVSFEKATFVLYLAVDDSLHVYK